MIDKYACLRKRFERSIQAKEQTFAHLADKIIAASDMISQSLLQGGKVLCCGNGGSASDALHFCGELLNRFERNRGPLAALCLNADVSTMTAIANDEDFAAVYAKPMNALARPGDVAVLLSTSGHSRNILQAAKAAHKRGAHIIALTKTGGGTLATLLQDTDILIDVPSNETAIAQEVHISILHTWCALLDSDERLLQEMAHESLDLA